MFSSSSGLLYYKLNYKNYKNRFHYFFSVLQYSISAMKCPANSHYEVCAQACSSSCPGLTQIVKCSSCTEGCECDTGFLFNGQTCVKETECGCYENGKTYKVTCNTKKQFHM